MTPKEFKDYIHKDGVYPSEVDAQTGLNILKYHFLGNHWYAKHSKSDEQVNSEFIYEILVNYPGNMSKYHFRNFVYEKLGIPYGTGECPPPCNDQVGLNYLINHFLGKDWYCQYWNNEQINAEAVYEILVKYPKIRIGIRNFINFFKIFE